MNDLLIKLRQQLVSMIEEIDSYNIPFDDTIFIKKKDLKWIKYIRKLNSYRHAFEYKKGIKFTLGDSPTYPLEENIYQNLMKGTLEFIILNKRKGADESANYEVEDPIKTKLRTLYNPLEEKQQLTSLTEEIDSFNRLNETIFIKKADLKWIKHSKKINSSLHVFEYKNGTKFTLRNSSFYSNDYKIYNKLMDGTLDLLILNKLKDVREIDRHSINYELEDEIKTNLRNLYNPLEEEQLTSMIEEIDSYNPQSERIFIKKADLKLIKHSGKLNSYIHIFEYKNVIKFTLRNSSSYPKEYRIYNELMNGTLDLLILDKSENVWKTDQHSINYELEDEIKTTLLKLYNPLEEEREGDGNVQND